MSDVFACVAAFHFKTTPFSGGCRNELESAEPCGAVGGIYPEAERYANIAAVKSM